MAVWNSHVRLHPPTNLVWIGSEYFGEETRQWCLDIVVFEEALRCYRFKSGCDFFRMRSEVVVRHPLLKLVGRRAFRGARTREGEQGYACEEDSIHDR